MAIVTNKSATMAQEETAAALSPEQEYLKGYLPQNDVTTRAAQYPKLQADLDAAAAAQAASKPLPFQTANPMLAGQIANLPTQPAFVTNDPKLTAQIEAAKAAMPPVTTQATYDPNAPQPVVPQEQMDQAKLNYEAEFKAQQAAIQQVVEPIASKEGSGLTGGTKKSGGTGGIPSAPSSTTAATGEGATGSTQAQSDKFFQQAVDMKFEYNPAEDQEYKLAASQLEQQVTDMMVGRGGLYSSVAQSALQNRMMSLQVSYTKMAYDRFLQERDWTMEMAKFASDREDTTWDKNFKMMQLSAQLEQQKFDNKMEQARLRISQQNAAYSRSLAEAKQKQADAQNELGIMQGDYLQNKAQYDTLLARWQKQGVADAEISAFFGGNLLYMPFDSYGSIAAVNRAQDALELQERQITAYARSTNDSEQYLDTLNWFAKQSNDPETIKQDYNSAYSAAYNDAIGLHYSDGVSWDKLLTDLTGNYNEAVSQMGTDNYNKLATFLSGKAS